MTRSHKECRAKLKALETCTSVSLSVCDVAQDSSTNTNSSRYTMAPLRSISQALWNCAPFLFEPSGYGTHKNTCISLTQHRPQQQPPGNQPGNHRATNRATAGQPPGNRSGNRRATAGQRPGNGHLGVPKFMPTPTGNRLEPQA